MDSDTTGMNADINISDDRVFANSFSVQENPTHSNKLYAAFICSILRPLI